jgi:hypothetical protein
VSRTANKFQPRRATASVGRTLKALSFAGFGIRKDRRDQPVNSRPDTPGPNRFMMKDFPPRVLSKWGLEFRLFHPEGMEPNAFNFC